MDRISAWLSDLFRIETHSQHAVLFSLVTILMLWLSHRLIVRLINKRTTDLNLRHQWRRRFAYLLAVIGLVILGRLWFESLQSAATFFGLASAGIAIALRDLVSNLAGWMFIVWRRPFQVGDRIQLGEFTGDVIDIRLFQFTILEIGNWVAADQSTGRIIHVPNSYVLAKGLANYQSGSEFLCYSAGDCRGVVSSVFDVDSPAVGAEGDRAAEKDSGA